MKIARSPKSKSITSFSYGLVLAGWVLSSWASAGDATLSYALAEGTSYVGVPLLREAVLKGRINSVVAPDRLQVTLSEHSALSSALNYYLEITSAPQAPDLEGERFNLWSASLREIVPASTQIHLHLGHFDNTRGDLPAALTGCDFVVRPHWTLSSLFGGQDRPSLLRGHRLISASDQVTFQRGTAVFTYFLETSPSHPHGRWKSTRGGLLHDPILGPGSALMLNRKKGLLRFTLTGEKRSTLLRRPLLAGQNLVSLPSLKASRIVDLVLTAEQGWAPEDMLTIWKGPSKRRYQSTSSTDGWIGLDSILGMDPAVAPIFSPTSGIMITKKTADPDFALRPVP